MMWPDGDDVACKSTRGWQEEEYHARHGLEACEKTLPGEVTSSKDTS